MPIPPGEGHPRPLPGADEPRLLEEEIEPSTAEGRLPAGRPVDRLRTWALATEQRRGRNKATVAFANKLARVIWATWRYQRPFNGDWADLEATPA